MNQRGITPAEAHGRQQDGAVLVDLRTAAERTDGMPAGALAVPMESLAEGLARAGVGHDAELLLLCARGLRSQRAAEQLGGAGFVRVRSVAGGFAAWRACGLPEQRLDAAGPEADERYLRQVVLREVGDAGQRRLAASRVLLVGAGGLGSPAALYLAAAGVGTLRLVDHDRVERSNLHRQVLHTEARIGAHKVASATVAVSALNPRVQVEAVPERLCSANVERLFEDVDVVLDGADNFPVRYLVSDACVHLGLPMVYGAVLRFSGQASVFDAGRGRGRSPCYRCLFPEPPAAADAPNCAEAGVLGVVPGLVGMIQATEVLKLLLGLGDTLDGRLLHLDALTMRFRETRVAADPECPVCAPGRPFPGYIDYARFCAG